MFLDQLLLNFDTFLNTEVSIEKAYLVIDGFGNCFLYPKLFDAETGYKSITIDCENLEELLERHVELGVWLGGKALYNDLVEIRGILVKGTTNNQPIRLTDIKKLSLHRYDSTFDII